MNGTPHRLLVLLAGLLLTTQVLAGPAEDAYAAGLKASRAGDYLYALSRFELAHRSGMDTPALDYNLGVCHYRLGMYPQAEADFLRASRSKSLKSLSHYNLGLVALAQRDQAQAVQWFRLVRDNSDEGHLSALAERQLDHLTQESADDLSKWWLVSATLSLGYDDNVLDPSENLVGSRSDNFAELFALASGPITGTLRDGLRLDASAYSLRYASIGEYDMDMLRGGVALLRPLGDWQGEAGLHYETSTLGGDGYLDTATMSLLGTNYWRPDAQFRLRYRYSQIDALETIHEPLQGMRQQFDAYNRWRQSDGYFQLGYQLELNDRDDLTTPTTFSSLSPTRHTLRMVLQRNLAERWVGTLDLSLRDSEYNKANLLRNGQRITRQDSQYQIKLRAQYPFTKTWEASLDYSHTHNDSNISVYDYDRNLLMVGITGLW